MVLNANCSLTACLTMLSKGIFIIFFSIFHCVVVFQARQLGYKQGLEKLSKDATEQATRNAKEIEQVKI